MLESWVSQDHRDKRCGDSGDMVLRGGIRTSELMCFHLETHLITISSRLSWNRVMLAPRALLECRDWELHWGRLERKAAKERRAKRGCWQVQLQDAGMQLGVG